MANGVIIPSIDIEDWDLVSSLTTVRIKKYGDIVTLSLLGWTVLSSITIPSKYRPPFSVFCTAEQRAGSSDTSTYERLVINHNGTITGNKAEAVGTFTWQV